jgi:hypothetical protein
MHVAMHRHPAIALQIPAGGIELARCQGQLVDQRLFGNSLVGQAAGSGRISGWISG